MMWAIERRTCEAFMAFARFIRVARLNTSAATTPRWTRPLIRAPAVWMKLSMRKTSSEIPSKLSVLSRSKGAMTRTRTIAPRKGM